MLLSASEIIHRSFNLNKKNWLLFIKYTLLSITPGIVGAVMLIFAWPLALVLLLTKNLIWLSVVICLFAAICVTIIILGVWFNSALILVIDQSYKNNAYQSMSDLLRSARQVIWRALSVSFLVGIYAIWPLFLAMVLQSIATILLTTFNLNGMVTDWTVGIGFSLLVLYGFCHLIYYTIKLNFAIYYTIIDRQTVLAALANSKKLVTDRWWGILWRLLAPNVVFWAILFIINSAFGLLRPLDNLIYLFIFLIILLVNLVMVPLPLSAILILFEEAKNTPAAPQP